MDVLRDFDEIRGFYKGFVGRQLLMREGKLIRRDKLYNTVKEHSVSSLTEAVFGSKEPIKGNQNNGHRTYKHYFTNHRVHCVQNNEKYIPSLPGVPDYNDSFPKKNEFEELEITSSVNSQVPLNGDFSNGNYQSGLKTDQLLSSKGDQLMEENAPKDQLIIGSPGVRYLEDEEAEWQVLDYSTKIEIPPSSLFVFLCEYDLGKICRRNYSNQNKSSRQSLYQQFDLWKQKKRKRYNIVVTTRAKKDIAENEKNAQKKLMQKTTLRHAETHRKSMKESQKR
ncbi:uncharacterized protein LOC111712516 [Eurytemora carolleeae]|uniref:uncharacterized protein LOC111712516 n=1 Tax=Eurytemora carolleeae TaxID=1294199 RepID=UPI000C78DCD6|nr:uncharacterized protein LOC111712516 [Eurytemora carolleeae]|eukprot:XP_023342922.1 uncharacterized protein LOC111712516 [Eurytemora affinis]